MGTSAPRVSPGLYPLYRFRLVGADWPQVARSSEKGSGHGTALCRPRHHPAIERGTNQFRSVVGRCRRAASGRVIEREVREQCANVDAGTGHRGLFRPWGVARAAQLVGSGQAVVRLELASLGWTSPDESVLNRQRTRRIAAVASR